MDGEKILCIMDIKQCDETEITKEFMIYSEPAKEPGHVFTGSHILAYSIYSVYFIDVLSMFSVLLGCMMKIFMSLMRYEGLVNLRLM